MAIRFDPLVRFAGLICLAIVAQACSSTPTQNGLSFELSSAASQASSATALVHAAIDAVARGERLDLAEPSADLSDEASDRLKGFQSWFAVFGESVQADLSLAEDFLQPTWGSLLWRARANGEHEYFIHIETWPRTPQLILPYELRGVKSAALLGHASGEYSLAWQHIAEGTQFFLPKRKPHPTANVVRVICDAAPIAPLAAVNLSVEHSTGGLYAHGWPGDFDQIPQPDFLADAARPLGKQAISLADLDRDGLTCIRWIGYLHVDRSGRYEVQLNAESGAKFDLDKAGEHRTDSSQPLVLHLAQGWHPVTLVWYCQAGREGSVSLRYRTRGGRFHEWTADQLATDAVVNESE